VFLAAPALAERRVALVLGIDRYKTIRPLDNAVNDAESIRKTLEGLGFETVLETNRDLRRMRRALDDFREDMKGADVALVYFAGHGVEADGANRLLTTDTDAASRQSLDSTSLPLEEVRDTVTSVAKAGLIILDACRNDPFGITTSGGRGVVALKDRQLARIGAGGMGRVGRAENVLFAFSAAPGQTAADGSDGHSPFARALEKYLGTDGLEIRSVLTLVQQQVYDETRGAQLPYVESGLPQLFFASTKRQDLPERERLLLAMAGVTPDIRAEVEQIAASADMPLAPLYGALIGLDDVSAPQRALKLQEAAEAFVSVRTQMRTLAADDPKVTALRGEAEAQLALGAFAGARQLLAQAAEIDAGSRETLKSRLAERSLSEASTRYLSAGAARASLRYDQAIADLEKARALYEEAGDAALAPAPADQRLRVLEALGELYLTVGNVTAASRSFASLARGAEDRSAGDPSDPGIRKDIATAYRKLGNTEATLGRSGPALASYRKAQAILQQLTDHEPPRDRWLLDLARTNDQIADVLMVAGDRNGALLAMQDALDMKRELALASPRDGNLQRELTISYDAVGDALREAQNLGEAEVAYAASLDIRVSLAKVSPDDADRQRDLSISHDKMGDMQRSRGDNEGALDSYVAGRDIVVALASRDRQDIGLQRDLSVAENKVGNVMRELGDLDTALSQFQKGLSIMQALASHDPGNSTWQRDLSVSVEKVADVHRLQGDKQAALDGYERSLAIMRRLSATDPSNLDWRHDVAITLDQVGNLRIAVRDYRGAHEVLAESLELRQQLASAQPDNASWQVDLLIGYLDYAQVAPDPLPVLKEGVEVGEALRNAGRLNEGGEVMLRLLGKNFDRISKRGK